MTIEDAFLFLQVHTRAQALFFIGLLLLVAAFTPNTLLVVAFFDNPMGDYRVRG